MVHLLRAHACSFLQLSKVGESYEDVPIKTIIKTHPFLPPLNQHGKWMSEPIFSAFYNGWSLFPPISGSSLCGCSAFSSFPSPWWLQSVNHSSFLLSLPCEYNFKCTEMLKDQYKTIHGLCTQMDQLFTFCSLCFSLFLIYLFLGAHLGHMDVPKLGVRWELQLPAYTTATATRDPSCICNLHHNSWQCWILNPQSKARDWTSVLMDASQIH